MRFSTQLPLQNLIELCRALRHNLEAGLTLRDILRQQAVKGSLAIRPVAERLHKELEHGDSLQDALQREKASFPPLFLDLASIGEETGTQPEIFAELEKYFLMQQRLRRQFLTQITWPAVQLIAAILIISFLIFIMGFIAKSGGGKALDPIGLGLTGTSGALVFLFSSFGLVGGIVGIYLLATRTLKQKETVDGFLLRVPIVGPCLRALALTRFCLALRLTQETGMSILKALRLSLRATGNAAYVARTEAVQTVLKEGNDLTLALTNDYLFPEEFRNIIAVAEESGRVPEVMRQQAAYYEEEAGRRTTALAAAAGWGVWAIVAALIIVAIFRIFFTVYLGQINKFT